MSEKRLPFDAGGLTNSQALIWMSQRLTPEAPLFNMAQRIDLAAEIDPGLFRRALQSATDASDALRTVFIDAGTGVTQRVRDELELDLPVVDFTEQSDPEAGAVAWMNERATRVLDLSSCTHESALLKLAPNRWTWFLNVHHLVADAWSVALILSAVSDRYTHLREGRDLPFEPLPAFSAYRLYESDWRQSDNYEQAAAHWKEVSEQPSGLVSLYGKRGIRGSNRSTRVTFSFGDERSRGLRELAARAEFRSISVHLTRFNLVATAVFAWLHRIGRGNRITIGTPSHNRPSLAFRETIGLFIETLPFSVTVEDGETFESLFAKVSLESNRFLRNAQPGCSSPALARQFNVVFNYINVAHGQFDGRPVETTLIHSGYVDSGHDLRIQVHDLEDQGLYMVLLDINTGTLDEGIRERAGDHFLRLLDAFIEDPSQRLSRVALATAEERDFQLKRFNQPFRQRESGCLLDAFQARAEEFADKPAVALHNNALSYRELDTRSERLALALAARGVGGGMAVGVCMGRSPDLIVAVLGILRAGAAFVPMESRLPEERLRYIARDAALELVMCDAIPDERRAGTGPEWLSLEDALAAPPGAEAVCLPRNGPESTAYILYTSGSTGFPKGVMVSHGAIDQYIRWAADTYRPGSPCDMPLHTAIGFDLTLTSMFVPLVSGGTILVYPEPEAGADLAVLQVFEEDRCDVVKLTPAHLALVLEQASPLERTGALILGGENLESELAARATAALGDIAIYNEYGPTEAVVGCMTHRYDPSSDTGHSVPIGVPAAHHRVYLLDDGMNPVPAGVVGEICIAGQYLSGGYRNRPEETSEKFLPDPFDARSTMYRTGDLATFSESGLLEYLGRSDTQLKIGGVRIEPAEIKQAVLAFAGTADCVVDVVEAAQRHEADDVHYCTRCGLSSEYPDVHFDAQGVCNVCTDFETYRDRAQIYFSELDELRRILGEARRRRTGQYDCIMLLSGGKDSTYALYRLAELGPSILALTLDNGFISDESKANIQRVVDSIGLDHRFISTPAMNEIFSDSLKRHSNVCQGCFKTIYTLAIQTALEEGIPYIVTGLSRGQFFETRLTAELFRERDVDLVKIEDTILEARKAYHGIDDAVSRCLDVSMFEDEHIFDKVGFIDFYRYCDVSLAEVYRYLGERAPWVRPSDTGRSTNCRINEAGIYVHKRKEGYHNYALPYSWDVRMGHKTRDAALEELDDRIDAISVNRMLDEIGYDEEFFRHGVSGKRLVVYYTSTQPVDEQALRSHVARYLPGAAMPSFFVEIDAIPLTSNGKVDRDALPVPRVGRPPVKTVYLAPRDELEEEVSAIWREVLDVQRVGISDNFYALGGDSISAIQIAAQGVAHGFSLSAVDVFEHQTVESLAAYLASRGGRGAAEEADQADPERFALANLDEDELSKVKRMLAEKKR